MNFWIVGDDMEDMFLLISLEFSFCLINGKQCNVYNFISLLSVFYGLKCYIFNFVEGGNLLLNIIVVGFLSGLRF